MADKSFCLEGTVGKNSSENASEEVIPSGEKWKITRIGGDAQYSDDHKHCKLILKFDTKLYRKFNVGGRTHSEPLDIEVTGDGTKKLIVRLKNNSPTNDIKYTVWLDAKSRG